MVPIQSRSKLQYYHRHYRRVPTIDECEVGDHLCFYEANEQFRRDRFGLIDLLIYSLFKIFDNLFFC